MSWTAILNTEGFGMKTRHILKHLELGVCGGQSGMFLRLHEPGTFFSGSLERNKKKDPQPEIPLSASWFLELERSARGYRVPSLDWWHCCIHSVLSLWPVVDVNTPLCCGLLTGCQHLSRQQLWWGEKRVREKNREVFQRKARPERPPLAEGHWCINEWSGYCSEDWIPIFLLILILIFHCYF